ncbi:MAG: CopG family transcriptional regulator [Ornithinimicrobium sp.]
MEKTTVYLSEDLKSAIKHAAAKSDVSEAEVIRQSLRAMLGDGRPRPTGGLFAGSDPIARRADELLGGFGDR